MIHRWFSPKMAGRLLLALLSVFALLQIPRLTQEETILHLCPLSQGAALPDGFYVWQQLNDHGIGIKSITPASDSLIVHLTSPEQSAAAREVLLTALPHINVISQKVAAPLPLSGLPKPG
ncbi:EnvZ/OmpR regulon moderator MzrA [Affinibrenneria salicis]|uniref:Modulator protein MzrA n=1 Tax=Affinibrenneria salicis TaxID=2590031 RepID=A0A5J5G832_9GAMM|nr:EnvZ/OmpR regulon moderator MzrA [Affinibrenneria salicis]KAA9002825.1 EnvZ/OmpR regulon moderator MzrA [Affinibrenneria salicis]KAA9002888.1 EnvZ/OmpR regulon moderator MzrA [Affinibrenneria salicis]